jgi:hypothetical protein
MSWQSATWCRSDEQCSGHGSPLLELAVKPPTSPLDELATVDELPPPAPATPSDPVDVGELPHASGATIIQTAKSPNSARKIRTDTPPQGDAFMAHRLERD